MHSKYVKISTVVGTFLLIMPNGLAWYWGNVSVYALSYIVYKQESASSVQTPWLISTFLASCTGTILASNVMARYVKRRMLILLSILTSDLATFMSYFAIQHSLVLLTVSYGLINGLASGFLYGNAIQLVIQCADGDVGILSSTLQAAFPSGAIIITQLVTWYCNPENNIPDLNVGRTVYFTDKDLIDKVPSIFLVLGSFSLTTRTIAYMLLQLNPEMKFDICSKHLKLESQQMTEMCVQDKEDKRLSNGGRKRDHTPKEVLRTMSFYFLWLSLFMNEFPFLLLTNYYKLFGQIWIHDDIFLTNLGTAMLFSTFIIRLSWGASVDRLGLKLSLMGIFGSLSLLSSWYYFMARMNRWLYFITNLLFGGICSSSFGCYMAAAAVLFGKTHVSTNFGMLMTASMLFNIFAPSLLKTIVVYFGWFFTYASCSILNLLNLILCSIFIGN